jgi:hypothetical protein
VKALRKLEKVHKDKGSKSFLAEEDDFRGGAEVFQSSEQETEHDIENYVYMMEGDMDQIFDEGDCKRHLRKGIPWWQSFLWRRKQQRWLAVQPGKQSAHRKPQASHQMCEMRSGGTLGQGVHQSTG